MKSFRHCTGISLRRGLVSSGRVALCTRGVARIEVLVPELQLVDRLFTGKLSHPLPTINKLTPTHKSQPERVIPVMCVSSENWQASAARTGQVGLALLWPPHAVNRLRAKAAYSPNNRGQMPRLCESLKHRNDHCDRNAWLRLSPPFDKGRVRRFSKLARCP